MSLGESCLHSQNRFTYPGHTVLNLRAPIEVNLSTDLLLRFYNLADQDIAERADRKGRLDGEGVKRVSVISDGPGDSRRSSKLL